HNIKSEIFWHGSSPHKTAAVPPPQPEPGPLSCRGYSPRSHSGYIPDQIPGLSPHGASVSARLLFSVFPPVLPAYVYSPLYILPIPSGYSSLSHSQTDGPGSLPAPPV